MIVQLLKLTAAALASPTYGVNAKLAELEAGGLFGADPTPPDVTVLEPSSDDFAALMSNEVESDAPTVTVMLAKVDNFAPYGIVAHRDGVHRLLIRYDGTKDDASELFRDCAHTMRAVLMSLASWFRDPNDAARKLEGVQIGAPREVWIAAPPELSQEASPVTFAAYVDVEVRDTAT